MKYITLFFLSIATLFAHEPLEKVSLQLQWLDQFQFAGYYVAKEKGFYKDAGFDVEIKKHGSDVDVVEDVLSQKTTYGIGPYLVFCAGQRDFASKCVVSVLTHHAHRP